MTFGIDNMAVIIDKDGDSDEYMDKYYTDMISKYKKAGLEDICDNLVYIKFDRYDGVLTIEEICTFVNYMLMCSVNGNKIMNMLNMSANEIKSEIARLQEIGY
jgi:hypothetical protein